MDIDQSINIYILIIVILNIINFILISGKTAILSLNENKISSIAEKNQKKAKLINNLIKTSNRFKEQISICIAIVTILYSSVATTAFFEIFSLISNDSSHGETKTFVLIELLIITLSIITLILTYNLPKYISINKPEAISSFCVKPVITVKCILYPFIFVIDKITILICKIFKINTLKKSKKITQEEILSIINTGNKSGIIDQTQKDMIDHILTFDEITAAEVMTHRKDISAVKINTLVHDAAKLSVSKGFSRIPVYNKNIDNITGIVHAKDFLTIIDKDSDNLCVNDFIRSIIYVPESIKCKDLFIKLKIEKKHMAIVIDDYGGTAGLVTMEDILESIFGNIQDEHDKKEENPIKKINSNTFIVLGSADIETVQNTLGITFDNNEYGTISGYLTGIIGRIPDQSEFSSVMIENIKFEILSVKERRIHKIKVVKKNNTFE